MNLSFVSSFSTILPYPGWQKFLLLAVAISAILGLYFWLLWQPLNQDIARAQQRLLGEETRYQNNQRLAQDLKKKKKEFAKLQRELKFALSMLPKKSELPKLLQDITWAGKQSGLIFRRFKPGREKRKKGGFYADMPVDIEVSGSFKELMIFLSKVGELPRIVDVRQLNLKRSGKKDGKMTIRGKAMTYRFIEAGKGR